MNISCVLYFIIACLLFILDFNFTTVDIMNIMQKYSSVNISQNLKKFEKHYLKGKPFRCKATIF